MSTISSSASESGWRDPRRASCPAGRDPPGRRRGARPRPSASELRAAAVGRFLQRGPRLVHPLADVAPRRRRGALRSPAGPATEAPSARRPAPGAASSSSSVVAPPRASTPRVSASSRSGPSRRRSSAHLARGVHEVRRVYGARESRIGDRELDAEASAVPRRARPTPARPAPPPRVARRTTRSWTRRPSRAGGPRTAPRRRRRRRLSREAHTSSRSVADLAADPDRPSLPHHTSASMNASSVVLSRPPSSSSFGLSPPAHSTGGCSGSRPCCSRDLPDDVGRRRRAPRRAGRSRSSPGPRPRAGGRSCPSDRRRGRSR